MPEKRPRGQFSLELLAVFAAYFALLSAFIAAENDAGKDLSTAAQGFSNRTAAANACFFLDFFAEDARNTAMSAGGLKNLVAGGHIVAKGGETAVCMAKIQGTENGVVVEQNEREPA